ncbi:MAG: prephenate dehydratase domain-containing protein [Terriglobales bacterium]
MLRVGYQGEPGAFSEEAALALLGDAIALTPCRSFEALFATLAEGGCDRIVAPIENSLAGPVAAVEALWRRSELRCIAELTLPIALHLAVLDGGARPASVGAGPGAASPRVPLMAATWRRPERQRASLAGNRSAPSERPTGATQAKSGEPLLAKLRSAASHPVALAQCRRFFAAHPWIAPQPAEDTAASVRLMVAAGDPGRAAIASRRAAALYGATILCEHVEDAPTNQTRFLLLAP